jgi:hypothetical protein
MSIKEFCINTPQIFQLLFGTTATATDAVGTADTTLTAGEKFLIQ